MKKRKFLSFLAACSIMVSALTVLPVNTVVTASQTVTDSGYRCGDVDGNTRIEVSDAVQVLMRIANNPTAKPASDANSRRAALLNEAEKARGKANAYKSNAEVMNLNVVVGDAVQILMCLANNPNSIVVPCKSVKGCDWCVPSTQPPPPPPPPPPNPWEDEIYLNKAEGVTPNFRNLTAKQLSKEITIGWNYGNAFDAHTSNKDAPFGGAGRDLTKGVLDLEAMWSQTNARRELIQAVKEHGFNTIRIPVTWYKVADPNNNWEIRKDFMGRVKEVVCWAMQEDLTVILNTHHEEYALPLFNDKEEGGNATIDQRTAESKVIVRRLWEQIGEEFKGTCGDCGTSVERPGGKPCSNVEFNERLIFEGLNEPRNIRTGGNGDFNGGSAQQRAALNQLNQEFVDTVREFEGNNRYRILMVPTYAAGLGSNNVSIAGFETPDDISVNLTNGISHKIAMSVHSYTPNGFCNNNNPTVVFDSGWYDNVRQPLTAVKNRADALGIPVILGEWGSPNKNNTEARAAHAKFYVETAVGLGMKCVVWDDSSSTAYTSTSRGGYGLITRRPVPNMTTPIMKHPIVSTTGAGSMKPIVDAMVEAAGPNPGRAPAPKGPAS